jgi:hypothetical protein
MSVSGTYRPPHGPKRPGVTTNLGAPRFAVFETWERRFSRWGFLADAVAI